MVKINGLLFQPNHCIFHPDAKKKFLFFSEDFLTGLRGPFKIVKCHCGLVFQDPKPSKSALKSIYSRDLSYFNPPVNPGLSVMEREVLANFFDYPISKRSFLKKLVLFPRFLLSFRAQLFPYFVNNGKLLDMGCSHGSFLFKMREAGWDVIGVEPSKAALHARKLGINVIRKKVEDIDFPESSFDVIVLSMVLEHLSNPDQVLKKIIRWLKPGGELLISIPYFYGLESRVFRKYCYILQPPFHIFFFGKKHMRELLRGFKVSFVSQSVTRDFLISLKFLSERKPFFKLFYNFFNAKIIRYSLVRYSILFLSFLGLTSRLSVRARKLP